MELVLEDEPDWDGYRRPRQPFRGAAQAASASSGTWAPVMNATASFIV